MKKLAQLCAVLAATCATTSFAQDALVLPTSEDDITMYRNAGDWSVHQNNTRKNCFISKKGENGGLVQMGLGAVNLFGYVGVFSQNAKVEEGVKDVGVIVNDNLYLGQSKGITHNLNDGYKGGYIVTSDPQFVKDLESGDKLVAFPETPYVYTIHLDGVKNAIYEARKCTEALQ